MGWGSASQVQDPAYSARAFFGGPKSPTANSGLLSVRGWQQMPLWEAAQTVQRSAFPMAYADHEPLSTEIVERLSGTTAGCEALGHGTMASAGPERLHPHVELRLARPRRRGVEPTSTPARTSLAPKGRRLLP